MIENPVGISIGIRSHFPPQNPACGVSLVSTNVLYPFLYSAISLAKSSSRHGVGGQRGPVTSRSVHGTREKKGTSWASIAGLQCLRATRSECSYSTPYSLTLNYASCSYLHASEPRTADHKHRRRRRQKPQKENARPACPRCQPSTVEAAVNPLASAVVVVQATEIRASQSGRRRQGWEVDRGLQMAGLRIDVCENRRSRCIGLLQRFKRLRWTILFKGWWSGIYSGRSMQRLTETGTAETSETGGRARSWDTLRLANDGVPAVNMPP